MHSIFISYRRSDSQADTGRIYDRLANHFGKSAVFKDVDDIPPGVDFRDYLGSTLNQCSVVVAIIGPTWISTTDAQGRRRLDSSTDWVRIEIQEALNRKDTLVVPLLVSLANMPRGDELPHGLTELAYRNYREIRPDPDFHRDMDRLIEGLDKYFEHTDKQQQLEVTTKGLSDVGNVMISRQQLLKWSGLSSIGLITALGIRQFVANSDPDKNALPNPTTPDNNKPDSSNSQLLEVDYTQLKDLLKARKWKEADLETLNLMLKITNREAEGYLLEDDQTFPCDVLKKLDQLWVDASGGKFGFSVQKRIYIEDCNGPPDGQFNTATWNCFIDKVGWRTGNSFVHYSEVIFDINAPAGHLPYGGECGTEEDGSSCFVYSLSISSFFPRAQDCNI